MSTAHFRKRMLLTGALSVTIGDYLTMRRRLELSGLIPSPWGNHTKLWISLIEFIKAPTLQDVYESRRSHSCRTVVKHGHSTSGEMWWKSSKRTSRANQVSPQLLREETFMAQEYCNFKTGPNDGGLGI